MSFLLVMLAMLLVVAILTNVILSVGSFVASVALFVGLMFVEAMTRMSQTVLLLVQQRMSSRKVCH